MIKYKVIPRKNMLTDQVLFYGQIVQEGVIGLNELADEIQTTSTVTRADILAVLADLENVIAKTLRNGKGVKLGDLGSFRPTIKGRGVEEKADYESSLIRKVNVVFIPSTKMKYNLSPKNPFVQFKNVTLNPRTTLMMANDSF